MARCAASWMPLDMTGGPQKKMPTTVPDRLRSTMPVKRASQSGRLYVVCSGTRA